MVSDRKDAGCGWNTEVHHILEGRQIEEGVAEPQDGLALSPSWLSGHTEAGVG